MSTIPETGFLRLSQIVPGIIPVARSTFWKWVAEGIAPRPCRLGPRTTAWRCEDINKFITEREAT